MKPDKKQIRVIANMMLSRAMVYGAPIYVMAALKKWVLELDGAEPDDEFSEDISASDHASLRLQEVKHDG